MYIVIGGAGVVGGGIAQIMRETHDVVVVDIDEARCAQIYAEPRLTWVCCSKRGSTGLTPRWP